MIIKIKKNVYSIFICALILVLTACGTSTIQSPSFSNDNAPYLRQHLKAVAWSQLPGWQQDNLIGAMNALQQNCVRLAQQAAWQTICETSSQVDVLDVDAVHQFFETFFTPYQLSNPDGTVDGLATGYYEPELNGSLTRHGVYQYPLYGLPKNVTMNQRLPPRAQLLRSGMLDGNELVWVDDPIDAFFLQIQGSGQVKLDDGSVMRLAFGGSNSQPYVSIGKWLLDQKLASPSQVTMQGIKEWVKLHPEFLQELLNQNPRFVFFRVLSITQTAVEEGPIGALGVPLTPRRSIAVDPRVIALGTPVFLQTIYPKTNQPLNRLVFAQDIGSAIKGAVRADFFWGLGDQAGDLAGVMKNRLRMWLLLPK